MAFNLLRINLVGQNVLLSKIYLTLEGDEKPQSADIFQLALGLILIFLDLDV